MSFTTNYRKVKSLLRELGIKDPTQWLNTNIGLRVSGKGVHQIIYWTPDVGVVLEKLAGPHGRTLIKMIEARHGEDKPQRDK
jgi:hypothetical protein